MDPAGRRLKIPIWMLLPECAEITISQRPRLGKQALLSLASIGYARDPVGKIMFHPDRRVCEAIQLVFAKF